MFNSLNVMATNQDEFCRFPRLPYQFLLPSSSVDERRNRNPTVWTFFFCTVIMDKNILYIRRYISDISDIGDIRHDIDDDRYIADISILDRYIMEISGV